MVAAAPLVPRSVAETLTVRRLGLVNEADLSTWLEGYRGAWETRDPEAAAALFSEDASYYEIPFLPPARGHAAIRGYWANATGNQSDVTFSYEIVSLSGDRGIVRWWAEFTRLSSGARVVLDGVFLLEFDEEGLCRELREWWHITETESRDV